MNVLDRARTLMERVRSNTRAYRFEGEQANHARQLAETKASIAGFEKVEQNPEATPEERYWLNQHRAGMEDRLAVFEAKPRLTVEEMNERDAIETHLYGAPLPRQGRNVLVARTDAPTGPKRFLAASPVAAILLSPWTWLVVTLGLLGLQTGRIGNLKDDVHDLRADLAMAERNAADLANTNHRLTEEVNNANRDASVSAANWQAERDRRLRAQQDARRIRDAVEQARRGESVDYGFGGVRNPEQPSAGAAGSDASGGHPG